MRDVQLSYKEDAGLTVVIAAKGYPGSYPKGSVIRGTEAVTGAKVGVPACHPSCCSVMGAKKHWDVGGGRCVPQALGHQGHGGGDRGHRKACVHACHLLFHC